MSELENKIFQIKENLKKCVYPNERSIITRVVMVLLGCLGWNVDNPLLVQEDYSLVMENISSKIDIALFKELNESNPEIYIKVKKNNS